MQRLVGIILVSGVILFIGALALPGMSDVFSNQEDPDTQVQIIEANYTNWQISSVLLGVAGVLTAIGLGMLAQQLAGMAKQQQTAMIGYGAVALIALGALFWLLVTINRATLPTTELYANLNINGWWYLIYVILTNLAMILFAVVLLRTGFGWWLVGVLIVIGVLQLALQVFTGDTIPALNYLPILILGIALIIKPVAVRQLKRSTA
jgi:hypothetical protein